MTTAGQSCGLRGTLEAAGGSLQSMTVMSPQTDPFRLDTPENHRDGRWLRDTVERLGISGPIHLRGLHYSVITNAAHVQHLPSSWGTLYQLSRLELREDAADRLTEHRDEIRAILDTVRVDASGFDFPAPVIPGAIIDRNVQPKALCDSRWVWPEQTHRLIASKNYITPDLGGQR